ncbi:hypothetical protein FSP39_017921 [Pinctada imbricata]|uniref:Uncharacterized protein n=1 Tax=Pinctada imbricata TaxID=66713 RepID=A0AA89BMK0_PINIB|nr:hypothetical protein FSP39_017921 [Pinctada imbricata]
MIIMYKIYAAVLFLIILTRYSECTIFHLQAEDYLDHGQAQQVRTRMDAIGSRTLFVPAGRKFILRFCLTKTSRVSVERVSLVNEVPLMYSLDYKTGYINGSCYNDSHCMDNDDKVTLLAGQHFLTISYSEESQMADFEIDYLAIYVDDTNIQTDVFKCQVFCFQGIGKNVFQPQGNHKLHKATLENLSHKSSCAEVDSIKVPIFHSNSKKIEVKATHPGYKTFYNQWNPDFSNCKIDNTILWRMENTNLRNVLSYGEEFYVARDSNDQRSISVKFYLEGVEQDSVDSDIGTVLTVRLGNLADNIEVTMSYSGRAEKIIRAGSQLYSQTSDEIA